MFGNNPYLATHELDSMGAAGQLGQLKMNPNLIAALARYQNGGQTPTLAAQSNVLGSLAAEVGVSKEGLYTASKLANAAKVELARGDDVMYGIDSGAANIAAAATATLTVTPQKRHIPQKIVLSANVANNFVVADIRAGVEPILITVGAISAAVFIQDSTIPPFRSVVMEVGMDFSITVTNVTGAAARFTATVLGKYLPWALELSQQLLR